MPIEKDKVVTLHYTLIDADNDLTLEKSGADAPMVCLHGAGNILAGLEQALEGKDSGDRLTVSLDPEQAYGRRDESLRQRLSANHPFAGRPLRFELEVIDVRDADADEKAHGHVHGPGGHAH